MTECAKFKYKVGDVLYAPSGPLLYKCKVLDTRTNEDGKPQYFIHYHNWNKNWDEWQHEKALHPDSSETMEKVKNLKEEHKRKKKRVATGKTGKRKKRKTSDEVLSQMAYDLPNGFKKRLQQSNDLINGENNSELPYDIPTKEATVRKILQDFHDEVMAASCESNLKRHMNEMKNGLTFYFEQAFARNLLYAREKKRWKMFLANTGKPAIDCCGVNFLLRLLLKLPALCAFSSLEPEQISVIKGTCQALLRFLRDNAKKYGLEDCILAEEKASDSPETKKEGEAVSG